MHHLPSRYIPCDGRLTSSAYFNPHSPQGERQSSSLLCVVLHYISIHAPRMESDFVVYDCQTGFTKFQSTLPAGGATITDFIIYQSFLFQSTLPAGGATFHFRCVCWWILHFNPRSPQGERRSDVSTKRPYMIISIHAPRRGSDGRIQLKSKDEMKFQSTLPAGGATLWQKRIEEELKISIHAPRRGSDSLL